MTDKNLLAIHGGDQAIKQPLKRYNPIGQEEQLAVQEVMASGILSDFIGSDGDKFLGGSRVREFETAVESQFGVKHAISVNSWTSGLIAAVGALDLEPGDEVIVPPFTMCATATAVLVWNGIPVFADIEPETFCLSPDSVKEHITDRTRAIMAVDIFGQSADMDALRKIAQDHDLIIINDAAQAPNAKINGNYTGCLGDIGGFSLNYHKHIHCGEGGVIVTDDDDLALRMRLIRNHGEAAQEGIGTSYNSIIGFNFRMCEIEAAIATEQMKKLNRFTARREEIAHRLSDGLKDVADITLPVEREDASHVYYLYPIILKNDLIPKRKKIIAALEAEGVEGMIAGYQMIYRLPLYQQKLGYGKHGFPWTVGNHHDYTQSHCPNAEFLHDHSLICFEMCLHELDEPELEKLIAAFQKVFSHAKFL